MPFLHSGRRRLSRRVFPLSRCDIIFGHRQVLMAFMQFHPIIEAFLLQLVPIGLRVVRNFYHGCVDGLFLDFWGRVEAD
ncbi:hypothetical protein Nepgr_029863 [Nepenthes gracilis]|uniref:Uncharacterized protein n=1 Tax=Nepenthes gracilis TaxID=150966 RepID=A0AAD3Y5A5_NEPGR|nr:hypothetical protein Nepgr_029863 [Nepenthes gracilis]